MTEKEVQDLIDRSLREQTLTREHILAEFRLAEEKHTRIAHEKADNAREHADIARKRTDKLIATGLGILTLAGLIGGWFGIKFTVADAMKGTALIEAEKTAEKAKNSVQAAANSALKELNRATAAADQAEAALKSRQLVWGEYKWQWSQSKKQLAVNEEAKIEFPDSHFSHPPVVFVSQLDYVHGNPNSHMRMRAMPKNVTKDGFTLVLTGSESDGATYHHWVRWIAIPAEATMEIKEFR